MEKLEHVSPGLAQMLQKAEELDWSSTVYIEKSQDNRVFAELEKYSPANEDFLMTIEMDEKNQAESFLRDLRSYFDDFDVDEHVEMLLLGRGKGRCPSSIKDLVIDAEEIEAMIYELLQALEAMEVV